MKSTGFSLFFLVFVASSPVFATGIYHWVDENGVSHFTQSAPSTDVTGVKQMVLEDTAPEYDPEEDRYGVQAQAERMAALRDEMAKSREDQRKANERKAAQQPVIQYRDRYNHGFPYYGRYPLPPVRPEPPIAVPYETVTLAPPGSGRN